MALGAAWRTLEQHADLSFFQSWAWTGCEVEQRFPAGWLLRATQDGEAVALGLFTAPGGDHAVAVAHEAPGDGGAEPGGGAGDEDGQTHGYPSGLPTSVGPPSGRRKRTETGQWSDKCSLASAPVSR